MNLLGLHAKLDQLQQHIQAAEQHLQKKNIFSADHQVKAAELRERYKVLERQVQAEVAENEAHGRHVTDLEQSVRQWLDSLEMEMD